MIFDGVEIAVGGGGESISLVQNDHANKFHTQDPALLKIKGEVYMPMIDTAEIVAKRYGISRERAGRIFAGEPAPHRGRAAGRQVQRRIAPITTKMGVADKATGEVSFKDVTLSQGRRHRARRPRPKASPA